MVETIIIQNTLDLGTWLLMYVVLNQIAELSISSD